MASFGDQLQAAKNAHLAASALDASSRQQIADTFAQWDQNLLTNITVRYKLEAIIRSAYRSSAAVAAALASRQSGIPGWTPSTEIFRTDYLDALLSDIRKNLREYKASDRGEAARRRAVLRMQLGAGVAAQRGYTDALEASYAELSDFGYELRKFWLANFDGNVPCPDCRKLHGTEVGLQEEFPTETKTKTKVFGNLSGPPRHPRCQCRLVILVVTLENAFEKLDIEHPQAAPSTMTTDDVKQMPLAFFKAVVKTLQKIIAFVKGS